MAKTKILYAMHKSEKKISACCTLGTKKKSSKNFGQQFGQKTSEW